MSPTARAILAWSMAAIRLGTAIAEMVRTIATTISSSRTVKPLLRFRRFRAEPRDTRTRLRPALEVPAGAYQDRRALLAKDTRMPVLYRCNPGGHASVGLPMIYIGSSRGWTIGRIVGGC